MVSASAVVKSKARQHAVMRSLLHVLSERRTKLVLQLFAGSSGVLALAALCAAWKAMCHTPWEAARLLARLVVVLCKTFAGYVARGFAPKFPKWTLRFEIVQTVARLCTTTYGDRMVLPKHARALRSQSEALGSVLGWFSCRYYGRQLQSVHFNGLEHLWLRSTCAKKINSQRRVVLYLHGGGFTILSPRFYISLAASLATTIEKELASQLNDTTGLPVDIFLANYRKAPEHSFPTPPEDTVTMYKYLLEHEGLSPSQIIIAGDSAGGGLVMSTLLRVRAANPRKLPLAAMLISPAVDLSGDKPPAPHCILCPKLCSAMMPAYHPTCDDPATWADASSVHCDLRGLPPVLVQAASLDYIYQHSMRLEAKARADGVTNWELDVHEGVPHVFSIFPSFVLPYAQVGVQRLAVFAATHFRKAMVPLGDDSDGESTCSSTSSSITDSEKQETTSNASVPIVAPIA